MSIAAPTRDADRAVRAHWSSLSLQQLWAVVAIGVPSLFLVGRLDSVDLAYHVRAGELMLRTHELIRTDPFSFTAGGRGWLDQQWGAQLGFAVAHRVGGWLALGLLKVSVVAVAFSFVYLACRTAGARARLAAGLTLGSFIATGMGLPLRPQLLAMALFAACLWVVFGRRRHPARLWALPAIAAVWANLHGSFFLVPLVAGLVWLQDRRDRPDLARRTAVVGVLAAVATLANPFGYRAWTYVVDLASNPVIRTFISEWQPPTFRSAVGVYFFASGLLVAVIVGRRRTSVSWPALAWLGAFFVLGLLAVRNTAWWALAAAPMVAGIMTPGSKSREREHATERSLLNTVIAAAFLAAGVIVFPWWGQPTDPPPQRLVANAPPGITSTVERLVAPGERMFNAQAWGSWFELVLPDRPVFVDSRIEVFPQSVWRDYQDVSEGRQGWQRVLDRWRISVAVIHRKEQDGLIPRIAQDPGWRLAYEDADGLIFVRTTG